MTLLWMDGFDHYTTAQLLDKGYAPLYQAGVGSTYARLNGQGLRLIINGYCEYSLKDSNKTTLYVGYAARQYSLEKRPVINLDFPFLGFKDESGVYQVKLVISPSYEIKVYNGDDTLLGTSATYAFSGIRWQYFETKVTISATVGVVEVKINGTQILNLTSQNTKNGSDYIKIVRFGEINYNVGVLIDDFYIDDAQFHGDCEIKSFMPDSISATNNDFTASAGNKDDCVDEAQSNEDTDYIISDTLNHIQTFGITTGGLSSTIKGIQVNNHCRLDQAGTRQITPIIRSNGTNYSGTETEDIVADYNFESEVWELDPDDSGAWTQVKLEAAEFGLEITT